MNYEEEYKKLEEKYKKLNEEFEIMRDKYMIADLYKCAYQKDCELTHKLLELQHDGNFNIRYQLAGIQEQIDRVMKK